MKEILNFNIRDFEGIRVVDLNGNLTANTVENFKSLVERIVDTDNVMINLEGVKTVSSSGLEALVEMSFKAKSNEKRVILLWPSEELLRMTEVVDVYSFLIFAGSLEEGQTKIKYFTG